MELKYYQFLGAGLKKKLKEILKKSFVENLNMDKLKIL